MLLFFSCVQSVIQSQTLFSSPLSKFVFHGIWFHVHDISLHCQGGHQDVPTHHSDRGVGPGQGDLKSILMTVHGAEDDDREIFSCKTEDGNWNDAKNIGRFDAAKDIRRS